MILVTELFSPLSRVRGVFYGWWLVGITAVVIIVCLVPFSQGMTAWFVVLQRHFPSWSRGDLSWAFALTRVEGGLLGPVEGFLIDRLGPRRMVLIGMVVLGSGFLLLGQVHQLWHLYVAFLVMSLGVGLGAFLPLMTAINNWFFRRRARAMAVAMTSQAVGGMLLLPVLAWAIDPDADRFGWRVTATGIGLVIIVVGLLIPWLVRNRPEDYGQLPDGDTAAPPELVPRGPEAWRPASGDDGFTWREAMRTRPFWLISIGHSCIACLIVTLTVHVGLLLEDRGLSLQTIAWVIATYQLVPDFPDTLELRLAFP